MCLALEAMPVWASESLPHGSDNNAAMFAKVVGFTTELDAQAQCHQSPVVWLDRETGHYHFKEDPAYGRTVPGKFTCLLSILDNGSKFPPEDEPAVTMFLKEWLSGFCAAYKRPIGDETCQPILSLVYLNGHILGITAIHDCGDQIKQAVAEALKSGKFPPMPTFMSNGQIPIFIFDEPKSEPTGFCRLSAKPESPAAHSN